MSKQTPPKIKTILFVRLPGILAQAARSGRADANALCSLVVAEGRVVRDACPLALAQGVRVGMSVVQARRLCPTLLAVPLEQVDVTALRRRFLDSLVDLSPVVEPEGLDAAYVDMTGGLSEGLPQRVEDTLRSASSPAPVVGLGISRLAAVLSVEPCGFWPVNTVVSEAQRRGVKVYGPCVNRSEWQRWALEDSGTAIRCSLSYVQEFARAGAAVVEERRLRGLFTSLEDFCSQCHFLSREQIEWLTLAVALDCLVANRRQTLWGLPLLHQESRRERRGANERDADGQAALDVPIPVTLSGSLTDFEFHDRYWKEWSALGFSPLGHPVQFVRDALSEQGVMPCTSLQEAKAGEKVTLAGLIIRVHKPPTAGGCVFFSLEDETALVHVTVLPDAYQRIGAAVYEAGMVVVKGRADKRGEGVSLLAEDVESYLFNL